MTKKDLKNMRVKLGFSQERLAGELGLSREMINKMERGHKKIEKRTELSVLFLVGRQV